MQGSHDALIVLSKHKLQFSFNVHNIATLKTLRGTRQTDAQLTPQARTSASS